MFKRTFSKIIKYFKIMLNIIKTGNYIKNSTINNEVKEIINVREYDEDNECWLTDLNQHISESDLSNNYTYLDTGFKYTDSKNLKPIKFELSIDDSKKFNDDLRIIDDEDNDFHLRAEKPLNSGPVQITDIREYHNKSEEEILYDSIISKSRLTEEKITNFKPTAKKTKLNRLNLNIQLNFDSDMLINSCEFLDIDIKKFGEYLTDMILKEFQFQFKRKLKESILNNLEPKLFIENNEEKQENNPEIEKFLENINKKYF